MTANRRANTNVSDIACKISNLTENGSAKLFGTLLFRLKAFIFGIKVAGPVECFGTVHLIRAPRSEISIGKNVQIISSTKRCTASSIFAPARLKTLSGPAKIIIGDMVGLNGTSIVARSRTIRIGNGTMIAPNVTIMDSDFHALWPPETRLTSPDFEGDADVTIGTNVWIGTQCIILKGVTIGDNSIIAAGSVVTRDIPPNMLAGGSPARTLRPLGANS